MMKFYYAPGSCAMSVHILLEDAEAKFEGIRIDLDSGYQSTKEYLIINPKGRVPALITENGVLTETPAILSFIAKKYPTESESIIEKIRKDEKYLNQIKNQILENDIIKHIKEKCKLNKIKKSFTEVMN